MTDTDLTTECSYEIGNAAADLFAMRAWNIVATKRNPDDGRRVVNCNQVARCTAAWTNGEGWYEIARHVPRYDDIDG